MTLFKQISLVVLVLFGIVFCGTLGISINNTRQYQRTTGFPCQLFVGTAGCC